MQEVVPVADIDEVKAAVSTSAADLPLGLLENAIETLERQHTRLTEALSGTGNDDAGAALALLPETIGLLEDALADHRAARAHCADYVACL